MEESEGVEGVEVGVDDSDIVLHVVKRTNIRERFGTLCQWPRGRVVWTRIAQSKKWHDHYAPDFRGHAVHPVLGSFTTFGEEQVCAS
jgi:hypothetical protein